MLETVQGKDLQLGDLAFTVRSFNEKAIGETGDQGVVGDQGPTGPQGPYRHLVGTAKVNTRITLSGSYLPIYSSTVAEIGDPNPAVSQVGDVTLVTGDYFFVFQCIVRVITKHSFLTGRLKYNGSVIADSDVSIGESDFGNVESGIFDTKLPIMLMGRASVSDLSNNFTVEFIDNTRAGLTLDSYIEIDNGLLHAYVTASR